MISKKERIALLQMLAIKENLTNNEFNNLLEEVKKISVDDLFSNVLKNTDITLNSRGNSLHSTQPKSFDIILRKLRINDPEKYELLQQLKVNLRSGAVLKNFSDIKDLLAKLDQASLITSSKATTVNSLLIYLSKKNVTEIRDIIKTHIRPSVTNDDKGFHDLANYIIAPKK